MGKSGRRQHRRVACLPKRWPWKGSSRTGSPPSLCRQRLLGRRIRWRGVPKPARLRRTRTDCRVLPGALVPSVTASVEDARGSYGGDDAQHEKHRDQIHQRQPIPGPVPTARTRRCSSLCSSHFRACLPENLALNWGEVKATEEEFFRTMITTVGTTRIPAALAMRNATNTLRHKSAAKRREA